MMPSMRSHPLVLSLHDAHSGVEYRELVAVDNQAVADLLNFDDELGVRLMETGLRVVGGASPLGMVFGYDGTPHRNAWIAREGGLEWVRHALGDRPRKSMTVAYAVDLVERVMQHRATDVALIKQAAIGIMVRPFDLPSGHQLRRLRQLAEACELGFAQVPDPDWPPVTTWGSDDLFALAATELFQRANQHQSLRECVNCGAPYIPEYARVTSIYCLRPSPGRTVFGPDAERHWCASVGPHRSYQDRLSGIREEYRKEYKRLFKRHQAGAFTKAALDDWRQRARHLMRIAEREDWPVERFVPLLEEEDPEFLAQRARQVQSFMTTRRTQ